MNILTNKETIIFFVGFVSGVVAYFLSTLV